MILHEPKTYDAVVVGAGFGGLGAALHLAERGADVLLCEALSYPGGCASTFRRGGRSFEAGATLFSGFGEGQLFRRWIERYDLDVEIRLDDPVVEFRTPHHAIGVGLQRGALLESLAALPGAPRAGLERFFREQERVADTLWEILDAPETLPPLDWRAVRFHLPRLARYVGLASCLGRTLGDVLRKHGLADFAPLRHYLDALCQITVQCPSSEADALFALGTMDYFFRGTGHVQGGIGNLAVALLQAVRECGGQVELSNPVRRIASEGAYWRVVTRRGEVLARHVVMNSLARDARALLQTPGDEAMAPPAQELEPRSGWGACMLYLELDDLGEPLPRHLDLVADPEREMVEGNHVFCSCGDPQGPDDVRTVTVSTHVPMDRYLARDGSERARYVDDVQARMRATFEQLAPEWAKHVVDEMTASPRTFERFTRRHDGFVGGLARRSGSFSPLSIFRTPSAHGLHLVGDSFFPGQSTLATAIGGTRTAERIARSL